MENSNTMIREAQDQVFNTTELLEAILQRLPQAATLHAQQVCKHWQAVIKTSSTLQRKLCFKADPDDALTWVSDKPLSNSWRGGDRYRSKNNSEIRAPDGGLYSNPILDSLLGTEGTGIPWIRKFNTRRLTGIESGLDMYLTMPPVDSISVRAINQTIERVHMRDGVGLRVRDIVDQMRAKVESAPRNASWTLKLYMLQS